MGSAQATTDKYSSALEKKLQTAKADETIKVWLYFTDKGKDIRKKLRAVENTLTDAAYDRRLRTRGAKNLLDQKDLPIDAKYLGQVKPYLQNIKVKSRWLNAVSAYVSPNQLSTLANFSFVRKIDIVHHHESERPAETESLEELEKNKTSGKMLNYGQSFTQNNQIRVVEMHNMGFDGTGVTIALLDAGFNNLQHEAIDHVNVVAAWDFVNGDAVVSDEPGQMGTGNHGTYILSTIAGFHEGELIGPAYQANYLLAKTENTDWERHVEEDDWVAGAEWADSLGADIISSSLGYRDGFTNGEADYTWQDMDGNTTVITIGADIAASRGIIVITSAGNSGSIAPPENTLGAPADGDSVLAIGSVTFSGNRSNFSSVGPTADGRFKPDVMAMGSQTRCASATTPGYINLNGTSLACPLAAGVAALILQSNSSLTNMEILNAMRSTASNASNPDNLSGWGILDAVSAAAVLTGIEDEQQQLPSTIELLSAYPNPFNPSTTIRYRLAESAPIQIDIYNGIGQRIQSLFNGTKGSGEHQVEWKPTNIASGIYYLRLKAAGNELTQKLVLLK